MKMHVVKAAGIGLIWAAMAGVAFAQKNGAGMGAAAGSQAAGAKAKTKLAFDVVSIRPSGAGAWMRVGLSPTGYEAKGTGLYATVMWAYLPWERMFGLGGSPMSGQPAWVNKDKYDIEAKLDEASIAVWKNMTGAERQQAIQPLLRGLLAERCKMVAHTVMVDTPVFELAAAKGGAKMKATPVGKAPPEHGVEIGDEAWMVPFQRGVEPQVLTFYNTTMARLASQLSHSSSRLVVDRTGLTGRYDLVLPKMEAAPVADGAAADPDRSLKLDFSETGLQMRAAKAPVEMLVVDHMEKPTEN